MSMTVPIIFSRPISAVLLMAMTALTSVDTLAKGAPTPQQVTNANSNGSQNQPIIECGSHRRWDPITQKCRGPGDF
jgi:hypothetical protein